jgi:cellulose synthase/poly-beta-1,6-N-acetylglucosamine synthase-like glycosyltransferase
MVSAKRHIISVIIPVRNEEENLGSLMSKLDLALTKFGHEFEIITVDDYSTDGSYGKLVALSKEFPLHVYKKQGVIGKGGALLEGIERSSGDIIVLLDADQAAQIEAIPSLIGKLNEADVIIGNRLYADSSERFFKQFFSRVFKKVFGSVLFGMDFDVQSGLKVFKKKIMHHMELEPSKWSFDLEFLLKARNAGYKIMGVDVDHTTRKKGRDKMNFILAGIELLIMTFRLKISPLAPVVFDKESVHTEIAWKKKRYQAFTKLQTQHSAIQTLWGNQGLYLTLFFVLMGLLLLLNWHVTLVGIITVLTILYFIDLLFNFFLIINSLRNKPEISISAKDISMIRNWPVYTIICPLFKEWNIVPQFIDAIKDLDYPKDKLQVILSLEEVDKQTVDEISKMDLPSYFEVLVTPDTQPRTKPKACNYALMHSRGEYIVIYDAEDEPEPHQLKKAITAFKKLQGEDVVCLQAKLNFYNPHQNLLTRMFSLEYSLWFDLVLTGLHSINAPIPLGGTSNHFEKKSLDLLQGWDPFNVTEDCDLGIRLFKNGFKTKVLDSVTMEEANSDFFGWFKQRSRWIKGYIQTYLVHMRRPHEFITDWTNPHLLTFQIIVGFKVLSMWINPMLWLLTLSYFALRPITGQFIESLYLLPVFYMGVGSLVVGNFLYFYYYMIGAAKREQWELVKYAFFVPFYWLMMSVSSWMALRQIIFAPHYWEKTTHGLHKRPPKAIVAPAA